MELAGILIAGAAVALSVIVGAVRIGTRLGAVTTTLDDLKSLVTTFVAARNGGSQCQRHEDAIDELRRDVAELKES